MCNSEMDLGLEASKYKNPRFDIVSRIAYLLGVSEEYFLGEESNFDETIYTGLEECKDARIVRNLCIIRTALLRNNGRIRNLFQYDMKNIDTIPEYMLMCDKVTLEFDRQQPIIPILYFDAENSIIHSINYVIIGAANLANKYV